MEWISVKDRLPEEPLQTIIVSNRKKVCIAVYSIVNIVVIAYYRLNGEWYCSEYESLPWKITHWMPLPSLPEE